MKILTLLQKQKVLQNSIIDLLLKPEFLRISMQYKIIPGAKNKNFFHKNVQKNVHSYKKSVVKCATYISSIMRAQAFHKNLNNIFWANFTENI